MAAWPSTRRSRRAERSQPLKEIKSIDAVYSSVAFTQHFEVYKGVPHDLCSTLKDAVALSRREVIWQPFDVTINIIGYGFEGAIEETNLGFAATAIRVAAWYPANNGFADMTRDGYDARRGHWLGDYAAARLRHGRWPHCQPSADVVHDASDLSRPRPVVGLGFKLAISRAQGGTARSPVTTFRDYHCERTHSCDSALGGIDIQRRHWGAPAEWRKARKWRARRSKQVVMRWYFRRLKRRSMRFCRR